MAFSVGPARDTSAAGSVAASAERSDRLIGLDGIRGLAALFVVMHHCWLVSFPGYPANTGPMWTGWLVYGHLAVVVFIVLSGFSLALAPARSDWQLGGMRRFFRRRAWRILPPYWAALILSLLVAWTLIPQPGAGVPTGKSVLVHALLLQDVFGSPSPNGAFWSIAIEAQLYVVLPLMLLIRRRAGAAALLALVSTMVVAVELLSSRVLVVAMLQRLTPQLAVLFAVGLVAAGAAAGRTRLRRLPWPWLALLATVPVLLLVVSQGPEWTVKHYFWVDLAVGPAVGLLLIAVSLGRPAPVVRWLGTRPLRRLGSFSYSLYLTHAPLVVVLSHFIVAPRVAPGVPAFLVTLAAAVPVTLIVAQVFAGLFELPFQRHRSLRALVAWAGGPGPMTGSTAGRMTGQSG
jgi:peptidoglycan/LPS O-acetylase OafA/YrhL